MRQFVFEHTPEIDALAQIAGNDAHYLSVVLRCKPGDTFRAIDRSGQRYICELRSVGDANCSVFVTKAPGNDNPVLLPAYPNITLYQCISKGKKMDTVVRQATEAGVNVIVPVISERTVPRYKDGDAEKKRERWDRIAREAVQQCGRSVFPTVGVPILLRYLPAPTGIGLCFHESPLENGSIHGYLSGDSDNISIVIGPEGGLSPSENEVLANIGYHFCWFGPNVLRTETAALYSIAAVMTVIMERDSWRKQS